MNTYEWNCKTVDCYVASGNQSNVIHTVHWRVTGTSDTEDDQGNPYTSTTIGTQALDTENITNFIDFGQLTHAEVVTWTKDTMGTDRVTEIEANLDSAIDLLITPTTTTLEVGD